jgi:hypothetical protein
MDARNISLRNIEVADTWICPANVVRGRKEIIAVEKEA